MLRESRLVAVGVDTVGLPEAAAVAQAWRQEPSSRPTAHHLPAAAVVAFGRRLQQVRIVGPVGSVFHAELVLDGVTVVSARPGDALALALHVGVPVLVDDTCSTRRPCRHELTGGSLRRRPVSSRSTPASAEELSAVPVDRRSPPPSARRSSSTSSTPAPLPAGGPGDPVAGLDER